MAPPPAKGSSAKVAIIVVIALVVVFLGVGITGALVWLASSSNTSYSGFSVPPQLVSVNTPVSGSLTSGQNHQVYQFDLTQTGTVSIAVIGDFDNYLELYRDGTDTAIAQDDDSGGSLNALINQTLQPGTYYALVRPFSEGTTGTFTITISAPAELTGAGGGVYPTNPQIPPTNPQIPTQPPGYPNNSIPRYPSGAEIQRQTLAGTVASVSGAAPVQAGTQCTVFVEGNPRNSSLNCRVRVYCGTNILYGRDTPTNHYGYARCAVRDNPTGAQFIEAHDPTPSPTGGDPRMDIDTAAGQVSVGDEGPQGSWTVLIRFTGAPAAGTPTTSI